MKKVAKKKKKSKKTGPKTNWKKVANTIRKLEEAFALDCTVGEACYLAEISQDTYYRWIKEDPKLSETFSRLREKPIYLARKSVIEKMEKDGDLALKYLERKRKKEFSLRTEHTGEDGNPIEHKITGMEIK